MAMWNRTAETLSRDEYAKLQLEGLKKSLQRVWSNDFYRARLQKGGLADPADVKELGDLARLPFFTKEEGLARWIPTREEPSGRRCQERASSISRVHWSSMEKISTPWMVSLASWGA